MGLHAPVSGATETFYQTAEALQASVFTWLAGTHQPADARRLPDATHILRLPNPQPREGYAAWADRVDGLARAWAGGGIPPGALIFQNANEPDVAGYDLPTPWTIEAWFASHAGYMSELRRRFPDVACLAPPLTCANTNRIAAEYVAPYEGVAVHCYWAQGNPGWRRGKDGGQAWACALFGKPIYVTELGSNPQDAAEIVAWANEVDSPLVMGATIFIADSAASWPEYNVTPDIAAAVRAGLVSPPPVPNPPPQPPEQQMDLWQAIKAVTDDPHVRAAMLMGAALETGTIVAPWPDQYGGGPGRGPWQIEAGIGGSHYGRISEDDARNPKAAARYMVTEYENAWANVEYGQSDDAHYFAAIAFRAERPAAMYPEERIQRAYALIAPIVGGMTPAAHFQIVRPVDCPVIQGSDGGFSHGGNVAGFYAIDYGCPRGTPCRAAADGTVGVIYTGDANPISARTGPSIWIDHNNGYSTFSCHMSRIDVATGDRVMQGQIIGLTGDPAIDGGYGDGAHLHWEIWDTAAHVRVKMEDLEAAGIAGPWGGTPIVEDRDVTTDGKLDAAMIERLWYGSATKAARKKMGYNPDSGIGQRWRAELLAGRPLGAVQSGEEADTASGRIVQFFTSGAIVYYTADGSTSVN